jgi:aryl-alcohol dehydrogenase-like predicted oxidoreductase
MKKRMLGNSGLEAAPLAFGGNVFGWTADEGASFRLLDAFVDAGLNLIDTADMYSNWVPGHRGGESETILGKWPSRNGNREKVLVATKVGKEMEGRKGLSKEHILRSAEESLRRLRTDRIDLYQSHEDDPETSMEETLEAFAELIRQGKVRAIGASNFSATGWRRRWTRAPVSASRRTAPCNRITTCTPGPTTRSDSSRSAANGDWGLSPTSPSPAAS